jgi:hypothetical protein
MASDTQEFSFFKGDPLQWRLEREQSYVIDDNEPQAKPVTTVFAVSQLDGGLAAVDAWLQSSVNKETWTWIKTHGPQWFRSSKRLYEAGYSCSL